MKQELFVQKVEDIIATHPVVIFRTNGILVVQDPDEPWRCYLYASVGLNDEWASVYGEGFNPRIQDLAREFSKFTTNALDLI